MLEKFGFILNDCFFLPFGSAVYGYETGEATLYIRPYCFVLGVCSAFRKDWE
jgi:hypothetical protein